MNQKPISKGMSCRRLGAKGAVSSWSRDRRVHMVIASRNPCTMALRPTYYVYIDLEVYIFRSRLFVLVFEYIWVSVSKEIIRLALSISTFFFFNKKRERCARKHETDNFRLEFPLFSLRFRRGQ